MEITENKLTRNARRALLATGLLTMLAGTGCRSGSPGWNVFGGRSEPSAATLAGSGPTTTYPSPPSTRATPTAIASIAGGTAPAQPAAGVSPAAPPMPEANSPYALAGNRVNSLDNKPPTGFPTGAAQPATAGHQPNAAAVANPSPATSFATQNSPVPPAYALPGQTAPESTSSSPPGVPNYAAAAANGFPVAGGKESDSKPSGETKTAAAPQPPAASSDFEMPPLNALTPNQVAASPAGSTNSQKTTSNPPHGFTLPGDVSPAATPPVASAPAAKPTPTMLPAESADSSSTAVAALDLPPADAGESASAAQAGASENTRPEYQTASANNGPRKSETTSPTTEGTKSSGVQRTGYMPGSTNNSSGYPSAAPMMR